MGKKEKAAWLEQETAKVKERRNKALEERGYAEFYKFPQGETEVTVDVGVQPREKTGDFGLQTILRVTIDGKPYDIAVKDMLYYKILKKLEQGQTTMTIVRAGEGKQTRYSLK